MITVVDAVEHNSKFKGFTLVEVLVVVVILSILAAVVVPRLMDEPDRARAARVKQDIRAIETALDLYKLDNFSYPSASQGLAALVRRPAGTPDAPNWKAGGYLKELRKDPWGNDYQYRQPGTNGEIDIFSLGRDGQLGGDGIDADIGNWAAN